MIIAVAAGRRIYSILKNNTYIVSIHIPILAVSYPYFGWIYPDIFTPVHVIFFRISNGPHVFDRVYENEPAEKKMLCNKPRPIASTFLSLKRIRNKYRTRVGLP
jgi:Ca2+-transporting ATPase